MPGDERPDGSIEPEKDSSDIREFFPTPLVQVRKDAFERFNLKSLTLEPEFLSTLESDVHLVADLISRGSAIPAKAKATPLLNSDDVALVRNN